MIVKRMYLMLVWPPVENKFDVKNQSNYSTSKNGGQQLFSRNSNIHAKLGNHNEISPRLKSPLKMCHPWTHYNL
jgi:hypothetical protein